MAIGDKTKKISKALLITIILISLIGCGTKAKTDKTRGAQAVPVEVQTVQTGDLNSINTLTGSIVSNLQTNVGSKLSGRVISVNVDLGQEVHKGQVLAQIDPVDLDKQLNQSQAQLGVDNSQLVGDQASYDQAQTDFQRYQTLFNSGAVSKADLEQSRLKLTAAETKLNVTQSNINRDQAAASVIQQQIDELTITAPVDGIIATKNIEVGEQVSPQMTLFSLVQGGPTQVAVNVSDQIIADVTPGTEAQITVPQAAATSFKGKVIKISPAMDATTHSYPIKIELTNPDSRLKSGMTASVQLTGMKNQPGIIIPVQAVVETPQGSEVFAIDNGVAHLHMIQLGAVSSDKAVVTSGLKAGEKLVINGQELLSDGSKVTIVESSDQAGAKGLINQAKNRGDKK